MNPPDQPTPYAGTPEWPKPFAGTPTPALAPTPRTDRMTVSVIIDGPQEARSACNTVTVNSSTFGTGRYVEADLARTLERELTETERLRFGADAERRQLRCDLFDAKWECERLKFALVEWEAKERGWSKAVEKDRDELARLRTEVERWELAFQEQYARAEKAEAAHTSTMADRDEQKWLKDCAIKRTGEVMAERNALAKELGNIANAKPHTWGDMSDEFQAWAQNRARHALAAMKGTI